jgi:hypothetical protein
VNSRSATVALILWLALGGCAGLVALAGLFLPGRLRRAPLLTAQPAE